MDIEKLYKKWTAGDRDNNKFTKNELWRGDMVKGFVVFCINNIFPK